MSGGIVRFVGQKCTYNVLIDEAESENLSKLNKQVNIYYLMCKFIAKIVKVKTGKRLHR